MTGLLWSSTAIAWACEEWAASSNGAVEEWYCQIIETEDCVIITTEDDREIYREGN